MNRPERIRIRGKAGGGCGVRMSHVASPTPAWMGNPFDVVRDPGADFGTQMKEAVPACLAGSGGNRCHCGGPLAGAVSRD